MPRLRKGTTGMSLVAKLTQERRARLAAERLLEQKQAELFAANRQLGKHARALSEEIVETRERVRNIEDENARVRDELSNANARIQLVERRLWQSIETIPDGFALFDEDGRLVMANRAYLLPFDGLTAVGPGVSYMEMLQFCTEEGIVDIGDMAPAAWREYMRERWQSDAPGPRIVRLWNRAGDPPIGSTRALGRYGEPCARYHGGGAQQGGAAPRQTPGRGGEPREIRLPREYEP